MMSMDLSFVFARVLIGIEFLIGIFLITGMQFRKTWFVSFWLLILFSIFLIIRIFQNNSGNCFCFGDAIALTPGESLIKNIVLLFILLLIRKGNTTIFRYHKIAAVVLMLACISIPFFLSPPDFLIQDQFTSFDAFNSDVATSEIQRDIYKPLNITEGKKIVCFFSMKCKFCRLTASKVTTLSEKMDLENNIAYVFFGNPAGLPEFWEESHSQKFEYEFVPIEDFFKASGKNLPAVYFVEDGVVKEKYGYRTLEEKNVRAFFGK